MPKYKVEGFIEFEMEGLNPEQALNKLKNRLKRLEYDTYMKIEYNFPYEPIVRELQEEKKNDEIP